MRKVGDTEKSGGIVTTITNIDPETGQITWDVDYDADYLKLFKDITDAFNTAKKVAQLSQEPFFQKYYNEIRELRNQLRTYLRKNKAEEYERIKGMNEMMTTGGSASFTANVGTGAQYATPFAFNKNKKAKGTASNYYYKLGYKPVDKKKLRKQAKGIEVKQLFEK